MADVEVDAIGTVVITGRRRVKTGGRLGGDFRGEAM